MDQRDDRLTRARCSLEGLSVGGAFGERFFVNPASLQLLIGNRALPAAPWRFTDDTQMALSIVEILANRGEAGFRGFRLCIWLIMVISCHHEHRTR